MTDKRVTVDFDSESYYLDGKYWESWDNFGEEMADKINELLNDKSKTVIELFEEMCRRYDETGENERIVSLFKAKHPVTDEPMELYIELR